MSHGLSSVSIEDVETIVRAEPLRMSKAVELFFWLLLIAGIVIFSLGVTGSEAMKTWTVFQVNFTYWFLLSAASTCFTAVLQISNAQWARPIRRIFEASSSFLLYTTIPLAVLYLGRQQLFIWAREEIPGKGIWLTANFLYARDLFAILFLWYFARKLVFFGLRRDLGVISSGTTGVGREHLQCWQQKRYQPYLTSWGNNPAEEVDRATREIGKFSPLVIIFYAIILTLIAFDQIMSVDPFWYSTLFGVFYFMGGVYLALAWAVIFTVGARDLHPLFRAKIEPRTLHDLGKLIFGFGTFWACLFWSHYLIIWYGNMPEETHWLILRVREAPWHGFAWLVFCCAFMIPFFFGLSRDAKQVPKLAFVAAVIVAVGIWLEQYLLFAPSLFPKEIPLTWEDAVVTLGFLAAYVLSVFAFLKKYPLMPFGDFYGTIPLEHPASAVEQQA